LCALAARTISAVRVALSHGEASIPIAVPINLPEKPVSCALHSNSHPCRDRSISPANIGLRTPRLERRRRENSKMKSKLCRRSRPPHAWQVCPWRPRLTFRFIAPNLLTYTQSTLPIAHISQGFFLLAASRGRLLVARPAISNAGHRRPPLRSPLPN